MRGASSSSYFYTLGIGSNGAVVVLISRGTASVFRRLPTPSLPCCDCGTHEKIQQLAIFSPVVAASGGGKMFNKVTISVAYDRRYVAVGKLYYVQIYHHNVVDSSSTITTNI